MTAFDDRWRALANRAGQRPHAPLPAPPRHLAGRAGEIRMRGFIPWPAAAAVAALLYLAMLPALPAAFSSATRSATSRVTDAFAWVPAMPHLPDAPRLAPQEHQ
jgi:hypothetical protein